MRAYGVKVIEWPDLSDLAFMGCQSRQGRLRSKSKARTRRFWKRHARTLARQEIERQLSDDEEDFPKTLRSAELVQIELNM